MPKKLTKASPKLPKVDLKIECRECGKPLGTLDANQKTILTELGRIRNKHAQTCPGV